MPGSSSAPALMCRKGRASWSTPGWTSPNSWRWWPTRHIRPARRGGGRLAAPAAHEAERPAQEREAPRRGEGLGDSQAALAGGHPPRPHTHHKRRPGRPRRDEPGEVRQGHAGALRRAQALHRRAREPRAVVHRRRARREVGRRRVFPSCRRAARSRPCGRPYSPAPARSRATRYRTGWSTTRISPPAASTSTPSALSHSNTGPPTARISAWASYPRRSSSAAASA